MTLEAIYLNSLAFFMAGLALVFSVISLAIVLAMKWSTHRIVYQPIEKKLPEKHPVRQSGKSLEEQEQEWEKEQAKITDRILGLDPNWNDSIPGINSFPKTKKDHHETPK